MDEPEFDLSHEEQQVRGWHTQLKRSGDFETMAALSPVEYLLAQQTALECHDNGAHLLVRQKVLQDQVDGPGVTCCQCGQTYEITAPLAISQGWSCFAFFILGSSTQWDIQTGYGSTLGEETFAFVGDVSVIPRDTTQSVCDLCLYQWKDRGWIRQKSILNFTTSTPVLTRLQQAYLALSK